MAKIYVASSWRNDLQPAIVKMLRRQDHEVYDFRNPEPGNSGFSWFNIDEQYHDWTAEQYVEALSDPIAEKGFNLDFEAMKWADVCVMVLPCGRSANTEAGWMKGQGKTVFVLQIGNEDPELMYKLYDGIFTDLYDLIEALKEKEVQDA